MKTVYFVRHGETEGNAENRYQHWDIPLSARGKEQSSFVAERFSKISFDVIVASDMKRATETARSIAERKDKDVILEPLFREMYQPTLVRGKLHQDPEVLKIMEFTARHFERVERHSDEENFSDLKLRAQKALRFIKERQEEAIVVVTHGTYLKMLMSFMLFGDAVSASQFQLLSQFFHPSNTGITKCVLEDRWRLWNWNDDAHLG